MNCPQCRGKVRKQVRIYLDLPAYEKRITKKRIAKKDVEIVGVVDVGFYYCEKCGWQSEISCDGTAIRGEERIRF